MKIIQKLGDVCAEDYGGGAVVRTEDDELYLEWTYGLESEHPGTDQYADDAAELPMEVFRVQLDEPAWNALSGHGDEARLWADCARCVGLGRDEAVRLAKSVEPLEIAGAFEVYASCYGWRNLDNEPLTLTYAEVTDRWEETDNG